MLGPRPGDPQSTSQKPGQLAHAWRDAEEIAAIADDMFVPAGVRAALERLRGR